MRESRGRGPYFRELRAVLGELDRDELEARLLDHARRLGEEVRGALLEALRRSVSVPDREPARGGTRAGPSEGNDLASHPLLVEIDDFVERLEAGEYYEGWGWDHDLGYERAFGDETWAWEMDDLLAETDGVFYDGERLLAREAYDALFGAVVHNRGEPVFPGPESPEETLESDLAAVKARYFRCVYELTAVDARPGRLLGAMGELWSLGEKTGLVAVMDADAPPLPEFERFLPAWTELLEARLDGGDRSGWREERMRLAWLRREAARLEGGEQGLAELARRRGDTDPEAYHEWITDLVDGNRLGEALDAATEGARRSVEPGAGARLADTAASLAGATGDARMAAEQARRAWRLDPSGRRLVALAHALDEAVGETVEEGLCRELREVRDGRIEPDDGLRARLELLAGAYGDAVERFRSAKPVGWSRGGHPGPVVFPFLLVAGSGRLPPPPESVMEEFWEELDRRWHLWEPRPWDRGGFHVQPGGAGLLRAREDPPYTRLLGEALERRPPPEEDRPTLLAAAEEGARARVDAIVSNKHRTAYERAARVTAAVAEARCLAGEADRGKELLVELRRERSRYYAFTRELRGVVRGAPLLEEWVAELE